MIYREIISIVVISFLLGFFAATHLKEVKGEKVDEHENVTELQYNIGLYEEEENDI